jgi:colicin import membrane protein
VLPKEVEKSGTGVLWSLFQENAPPPPTLDELRERAQRAREDKIGHVSSRSRSAPYRSAPYGDMFAGRLRVAPEFSISNPDWIGDSVVHLKARGGTLRYPPHPPATYLDDHDHDFFGGRRREGEESERIRPHSAPRARPKQETDKGFDVNEFLATSVFRVDPRAAREHKLKEDMEEKRARERDKLRVEAEWDKARRDERERERMREAHQAHVKTQAALEEQEIQERKRLREEREAARLGELRRQRQEEAAAAGERRAATLRREREEAARREAESLEAQHKVLQQKRLLEEEDRRIEKRYARMTELEERARKEGQEREKATMRAILEERKKQAAEELKQQAANQAQRMPPRQPEQLQRSGERRNGEDAGAAAEEAERRKEQARFAAFADAQREQKAAGEQQQERGLGETSAGSLLRTGPVLMTEAECLAYGVPLGSTWKRQEQESSSAAAQRSDASQHRSPPRQLLHHHQPQQQEQQRSKSPARGQEEVTVVEDKRDMVCFEAMPSSPHATVIIKRCGSASSFSPHAPSQLLTLCATS